MADTIEKVRDHFLSERVFYSRHAKSEMQLEEFGEILDREVAEAVASGRIIEDYPEDTPYPSCLIFGTTDAGRPIHVVCACSAEENFTIIVTVYHPDPQRWIGYERRLP
jgi:hypothetical protein